MESAQVQTDDLQRAQVPAQRHRKSSVWSKIWKHRWLYVLLLPGVAYFVIFVYVPMLGNVMALQNYNPFLGFFKSPWVGLKHFQRLFTSRDLGRVALNTIVLSGLQIGLTFPAPIVLALMLNEVRNALYKRAIQTIIYLPHFISWVILIGIWYLVFGSRGVVNQVLLELGLIETKISFLTDLQFFRPSFILQTMWRNAGWGTIIFLAALSGINVELYEAAAVDGASRWQQLWYITLPGILPVITIVLILRMGGVLSVGFTHIFLVQNSTNVGQSEVLDTFVYWRGLVSGNFSFATAVGLVRSSMGMLLILSTNWLSKRLRGQEGGVF